ncbi:MAG: universal stress protein [Pseudobdellovibrionaceae bacterium]|nr:universal stress protein [Pseudobdellovibrionaceae bacterium]
MLELFSAHTTIVVGLSLNDREDHIVKSAVSLAQRTYSQLILVHAREPYRSYSLAREGFALPYEEVEQATSDAELVMAQNKIDTLKDNLPSNVVCETRVFRDYPEDAIEEVARNAKASLIMCGFHRERHPRFFGGMSTALSMMAHSRHPVMVVPGDRPMDFLNHPLSVLVADDLQEDGAHALRGAIGFCRSIDVDHLVHAHVNSMSYREINHMVEKIRIAMLEGHIPSNPEFDSHVYIEETKAGIKAVLKQRIEELDPGVTQDYKYRPSVRFGVPIEEIHRLTVETKSSVLIFGKHHMLHRGRISLGKVPYEAMVEPHVATIIVPDPGHV